MRMPAVGTVCLLLLGLAALVSAQTEDSSTANPARPPQSRVQLQSISVYSGYYTSGSPVGFDMPAESWFVGPTVLVGTTVTLGGSISGERSSFNWKYSPSYFSTVYSERNQPNHGSLNHRFGMNWRRKLTGKWTLSSSANGFLANMEQLYFAPAFLSSIASLSTSYDDLTAAILAGKFNDPQLAALLTGAPVQGSPEQAFPYGNRLLSASANVALTWTPSGRTTIAMTLTGTRTQHVNGAGAAAENIRSSPFILPQLTNVAAEISWSYSLSPRTQIGVEATSSRTFSRIYKGYGSSGTVTLGRTLSRRWFAQAKGGAGALTFSHQLYAKPTMAHYLFGGSIGFKTSSHTFLAAYDRSLGDLYGLGSETMGMAGGAWNWNRPGSGWSSSASLTYQQLNNKTFRNVNSWRAEANLIRALGRHCFVNWQYIYFELPADMRVAGLRNAENGLIVSLAWAPATYK